MTAHKNIKDLLRNSLPSASKQEVQTVGHRVLERLQSDPDRKPVRFALPFDQARRTSRQWVRVVTIAAAVAIAILIPVVLLQRAPAIFEDIAGSRRIQFDEVVRANDIASSTLVLADTSRVEMREKSELSLERADDGVRIRLRNGDVIVNAAKQHGHLYVQTKDVTVSVVGTVFLVKAEAEGSRVAVIEGEVHVTQGSTETKLRPGEEMTTSPKMETIPLKDEVAWSSQAVTHVALLLQSTPASPVPQDTFDVVSIRRLPEANGAGDGGRGTGGQQQGGGARGGPCQGKLQLDPNRLLATNAGVYFLIALAYDLDEGPFPCGIGAKAGVLSGGPDWIQSANFNIEAGIPEGPSVLITQDDLRRGNKPGTAPLPIVTRKPGPRLRNMVRAMLEDRFKLKLRREMKEMPVYVLSGGSGGAKLTSYKENGWIGSYVGVGEYEAIKNSMAAPKPYEGMLVGGISGGRATTAQLAIQLSQMTGRPVLDRTNLPGFFNYEFFFAPADYGRNTGHDLNVPDDPRPRLSSPTLFKVLEDELGLRLVEGREKVEVFVVESIKRPSEN